MLGIGTPSTRQPGPIFVSRRTSPTQRFDHYAQSAGGDREIMVQENTLPRRFRERRPPTVIEHYTTHRGGEGTGVARCDEKPSNI